MKTKKTPQLEEFRATEIVDFDGGFISSTESENGEMRAKIRIIKAGLSKNNRNYRVGAIKKAAQEGIFNGVRMFVNHADRKKPNAHLERGYMEMVSAIESTEYDEANQALNGNVVFFDEAFYRRADRAKAYTGVSIDALLRGTRQPQPGGRALEDIHEFAQPRSVDWVVYPAAGGQILAMESEEGDEDVIDWAAVEAEASKLSEEDLKKNLPTLWAKWKPENHGQPGVHGSAQEGDEKEYVAKEEIDEIIRQRFTAYEEEQRKIRARQESAAEQVRAAFATSGLPERTRTRLMVGFEGLEEFNEDAVKQAIEDAKEELKAAGAGPIITGMGPSGSSQEGESGAASFSIMDSVERQFGKPVAASSDASKEGK